MHELGDLRAAGLDFLDMGGPVLVAILLVTFLMWILIIERYRYLRVLFPVLADELVTEWRARAERTSWHAHQIRREMISRATIAVRGPLVLIRTFVAVCPMLGLLGTVTGVVEVFDVMAVAGSGNARALASGVSRATIPTMAGMVAALSGFIVSAQLARRVEIETTRLADHLSPGI
jgi:biopolymer transport protein ExbB